MTSSPSGTQAFVLRELVDRSPVDFAGRDPRSAGPVREMTSRIIKGAYRKSCVPLGNEFVCKLLDHRSQSPRTHMRPTRWQGCALVRHDCPPWVGVKAPKESRKLCRALRLVSDGEIPGLQRSVRPHPKRLRIIADST